MIMMIDDDDDAPMSVNGGLLDVWRRRLSLSMFDLSGVGIKVEL